jgi:RHS repeat-associated protein
VVERPVDPDGPANGEPCETGCEPVEWVAVASPTGTAYSAARNPFMWTGQRYDAVSATYHFHARTYLPHLGRWGQRDPLEYVDGVNLYEYVQSQPLINIDPLGLALPEGSRSGVLSALFRECDRLWEKIREIENRIRRRIGQLKENPQGLSERCPGDEQWPSLSRWGHRVLIEEDKALLAQRLAEYWAKCMDHDKYPVAPQTLPIPRPTEGTKEEPTTMEKLVVIPVKHFWEVAKYVGKEAGSRIKKGLREIQCRRCGLIHP